MPLYSSLPVSLGYSSHLPRRRYYRPASFYLDDGSSSAFAPEELGYSPFSHTLPPRVDAETRYRRALYELQDAEQEFEAHVALERARQVAILRQRAAAEAARREGALAIQAEIERAHALQAQLEEYEQRQDVLQPDAALDWAPYQQHPFLHTVVDANINGCSARNCSVERRRGHCRRSHCRPTPAPARHDTEAPIIGEIFKLFSGINPELQPAGPPTSPAPSQQRPAGPQPPSSEPNDAEVAFNDVLEFFHDVATRARGAAGEHKPTHEPSPLSQPEASPVDEKGKGKAKAEPQPPFPKPNDAEVAFNDILDFFHSIAARAGGAANPLSQPEATPVTGTGKGKAEAEPARAPALLQTLLRERMQGGVDQEVRDLERAIQLSLQERDGADVKKANSAKARRSSPGASSSKAKVEGAPSVPSGSAASPTRGAVDASATSTPGLVPQPASALTTVRSVRTQLYAVESAFKFPAVLDFDQSELAVTLNNAPVRAYEQALNGLLEQLDAIESDGDEEIRNVRREVVKEVEKALGDVERRVREQAPQAPAPEVTKGEVNGYDVVGEEPEPLPVDQDAPPADLAFVNGDVKLTEAEPAVAASSADADIDLAISGEYVAAPPGASSVTSGVAPPANEDAVALDTAEAGPASEGVSDSIATITPPPAAPASAAAPGHETFLASMSHHQFTFPPKPTSNSSTSSAGTHDDAVLVDNSDDGESVKGAEDGWSEVDG